VVKSLNDSKDMFTTSAAEIEELIEASSDLDAIKEVIAEKDEYLKKASALKKETGFCDSPGGARERAGSLLLVG
jgi:hypothetical protein